MTLLSDFLTAAAFSHPPALCTRELRQSFLFGAPPSVRKHRTYLVVVPFSIVATAWALLARASPPPLRRTYAPRRQDNTADYDYTDFFVKASPTHSLVEGFRMAKVRQTLEKKTTRTTAHLTVLDC